MSTPYLEAKKTALLVVDYQNFYIDEGSLLEMPNAREGLPLMNDLVTRMKEKGCLIVYIRCTHYLMHNNAYPRKWPQHFKPDGDCYLKPGTHDFDVCDQLAKVADYYVDKDRWSAFFGTNLDIILRDHNIRAVAVCGLATPVCCESTARDASFRDYDTIMLSDCNFALSPESHAASLENFEAAFGWVMSKDELLEKL